MVINGYGWLLNLITGYGWLLSVINGYIWLRMVIDGVITGYGRLLSHQWLWMVV